MSNAVCEHFGRCGGCTYLDISYEEELEIKKQALTECLSEYGHLLEGVIPSPLPAGYRNKMELAFGDEGKDGRLALGMRKRRSYYEVATPDNCVLIPGDFKKIIMYVLEYFRDAGETFYHRKRHTGALRHLVLRRGEFTGEILLNLSAASGLATPLQPLAEGLLALPLEGEIAGILHSVNDGVAEAVKDEDTRILWGRDYYNEEICGLKFKVGAFSFFQTNSAGAEVLYGIVRDYAALDTGSGGAGGKAAPHAYDLYCGTGTIAQIISPSFAKVTGIELSGEAIRAAKDNAELNGITNCGFFAGDVLTELDNLRHCGENIDVVIVDPPRDGLHSKALAKIISLAPRKLIYVACKPASLARDMVALTEAGYRPERIAGVDMFPRTPHVECVCEFISGV